MPRVSTDQLAARRQHILDGARRCFAAYGYEGATVRRLEQSTGLSRGAIFHYFRDKDALFLALAEQDAARMADVVAAQGLVQVMRDLLDTARKESGDGGGAVGPDRADGDPRPSTAESSWLGTRLEVSRRLRTDPDFRERWQAHSAELTVATRDRLERQAANGTLRDDVPVAVLTQYLELVLEGLVSHLAMGLPADTLDGVLDVVEQSVRRR